MNGTVETPVFFAVNSVSEQWTGRGRGRERKEMDAMKEKAANVAASAKAGMEKTKAVVQEKVEKLTAHDEMDKQMATQKKEEKKAEAELKKLEAYENNAAARQAAAAGGEAHYTAGPDKAAVPAGTTYSVATGAPGRPTGSHQMSALPGHATGQPAGPVEEGVVGARLVGIKPASGSVGS